MRGRRVLVVAGGMLVGLLPGSVASAAAYPSGSSGHDVSYPQCTSSGATTTTVGGLGGAFGIVGVTGGRPFSANSCSTAEDTWAAALPDAPSLYMNTANPAPTSSYYWPTSGSSDPALCQNAASTTDPGCAYDYGWHAAADALTTEARNIPGAASLDWWLDVETANSWNGNGTANAADLQGVVDYLRSHGVPSVGLYSTASQWTSITGGYSAGTAASYASAWAPEFTAQYPMTGSPDWIAGLGSASAAATACGTSFTGGPTWLAQYSDGSGVDADYSCTPSVVTAPTAPANLAATAGNSVVTLSWSAPANGGRAPVTYAVYRGTSAGAEASTPIATGVTSTSFTDSAVSDGTTYYYEVAATNSAGTSAMSNEASATAEPAPQAFTVAVSPTSARVKPGGSASATVTVTETGPSQAVSVSVSKLPAGVSASVSPASLNSSGTATLKIAATRSAKAGTYPLSVTGTGASGTSTATYTLTVR